MKVLVLSPHADDIEIGCGATIAKFTERGYTVDAIVFSLAEQSLPNGYKKDDIRKELDLSYATLGISNYTVCDYEVRRFDEKRQEILDLLIKNCDYDMVLCPSLDDCHQDHGVIAKEALRAYKRKNLLAYQLLWNTMHHKWSAYSIVKKKHVRKKWLAVSKYQSQSYRSYMKEKYIYSLATTTGVDAGSNYAEVFEVYRWILE